MYNRLQNIEKAMATKFDVVVIGGGITGAGIALKSIKKGLRTLIIDKNDFASGTSSRSAKMIHGGLRYLQYLQIKLVKEALLEREHLLQMYPHLVSPQPFFMPIYKSKIDKYKLEIGLSGYDYLSGESSMPKHESVDLEQIKIRFPQIKIDDLKSGFIYYDAKTNDARLTNDVIQEAVECGAIALNYVELVEFKKDENTIKTIICKDNENGNKLEINAKIYINASGVWTDDVLKKYNKNDTQKYLMPSKGIHLVVSDSFFSKDCVMLFPTNNNDGRTIWCMPWENNLSIIGTTDTEYSDSIDQIITQKEEVNYILDSVNAQLKNTKITENDILSVYAGLRPLLNDNDESKKSNQRSRDYTIWWNNDNMLTIAGGKLTSFLSMADSVLDEIENRFKKKNRIIDNRIENIYGIKNSISIYKIMEENSQNRELLDINYNYTIAEIIFFIRYQSAIKLDDILTRRTTITYSMQNWHSQLIEKIATIMANELHWTAEKKVQEIENYEKDWAIMHTWK